MTISQGALLSSLGVLLAGACHAVEIPMPSKKDTRLREVMYSPDEVYRINIILGVGTRIILGKDEQIKTAAPGFGADCKDEAKDWCIVANVGANEIYVKAKSKAKEANNLEVTTDKRVYSFDFVLNEKFKRDIDGMFRVTFNYPDEAKKINVEGGAAAVKERLDVKKPRNWNYAKEALPGSEGIDPAMAYDDGRFTYFKFAGNKQMPAVFVVEANGKEANAATHVEGPANDTLVVHRVAKRFVLRLENQVVGIWNDSFDQAGVTAPDGMTVDGLKRVVKVQQ
jgi:type IV secretion system protein VirB9